MMMTTITPTVMATVTAMTVRKGVAVAVLKTEPAAAAVAMGGETTINKEQQKQGRQQ